MSRYPLTRAAADSRFGFGVTAAVAKVLASYGFPNMMSFYDGAPADFDRLQTVLAHFVYGATLEAPSEAMPLSEWVAIAGSSLAAAASPTPTKPVGAPVEFRLIGSPDAAAHAAEILRHVFTLTYVSDPYPTRNEQVRIYLTGHRAAPYKGGIK